MPLLVDFQGTAIATTLPGLAEQIAKQIIEAARRLPRRLDFPDPGAMFRVATDPFIVLESWFAEIERTFPDKRFLLCLETKNQFIYVNSVDNMMFANLLS